MAENDKGHESLREALGSPLVTAVGAAVVCVVAYVARNFFQGKLDACNSVPGRLGRLIDQDTATNCGMVPLLFDIARGFFYLSLVAALVMSILTGLLAYFHFSGKDTLGRLAAWSASPPAGSGPGRLRALQIPPGQVTVDDMMTEMSPAEVREHVIAICERLNTRMGLTEESGYSHWIASTGENGMVSFGKPVKDTTQVPPNADADPANPWWSAAYTYNEHPNVRVISIRPMRATLTDVEHFDRQTLDALVAELASATRTTA